MTETVSLAKGGNVSLTKIAPNLSKLRAALGWEPRTTDGAGFDLDASCFLLNADNKVKDSKGFIFYGNLTGLDGAVKHTGDNQTGQGEGDDESIIFDLPAIPADIVKIAIVVTIHEADVRRQNFGQVSDSFIRIVDEASGAELTRYDLGEDFSTETALNFGEIYRHNAEWKFRAVGQGYKGGLKDVCSVYGVNAS